MYYFCYLNLTYTKNYYKNRFLCFVFKLKRPELSFRSLFHSDLTKSLKTAPERKIIRRDSCQFLFMIAVAALSEQGVNVS